MDADLFPPAGNLMPEKFDLDLVFTSGASGAVPTTLTVSRGIATVVRDNTGLYTATMSEVPARFIAPHGAVLLTGGAYDATKATAVHVFAVSLSSKTIKFATVRTDTGAATDMASGDVLTLTNVFQKDTIGF